MSTTTSQTAIPPQPNPSRSTPPSSGRERRPPSSRGFAKQNSKTEIGIVAGAATGKRKDGRERKEREKSVRDVNETEERGTPVPLTYSLFSPEQLADLGDADVDEAVNKVARFLSLATWREDLQTNILVSFHFCNYLFAKDNNFTPQQIGALCAIMKTVLDRSVEKALPLPEAVALFRKLLLGHFSPTVSSDSEPELGSWEIFGFREVKLATDWAASGLFPHYRLHYYVLTTDQERQNVDLSLTLEYPQIPTTPPRTEPTSDTSTHEVEPVPGAQPTDTLAEKSDGLNGATAHIDRTWPPPLSDSTTLEEYEAELERKRMEEERIMEEEQKRREAEEDAGERLIRIPGIEAILKILHPAAANPFAVLTPEHIKQLAGESVVAALASVTGDVERALEEQKQRFLSSVGKVIG
ncbi:hypothetical protein HK097_007124 [Rhizophlyctis rosea]|uniref:Uncharacterized protein n=1 Tax=Rhizophlyctis rosea TaxID=64517 RepID=A0AAD5SJS2_9FUNG|nr:hypothetical protein HK097_007124 [Rhizophlyctis rosea]